MRSRRGGRSRDRKRDRFSRTAPRPEREAAAALPVRFVQFADLTGCDVDGCSAVAVPEAWEFVDLDTGDEQPGRFCEEHQLAWLRRPRRVSPAVG